MIGIDSIVVSCDQLSFKATTELYHVFDEFIQILTESLSEEVINAIINIVRHSSSEIYDITKETLLSLFEDYKCYQMKRFEVEIYLSLYGEDNEPIENIFDSLNIKDLKTRYLVREYMKTKCPTIVGE